MLPVAEDKNLGITLTPLLSHTHSIPNLTGNSIGSTFKIDPDCDMLHSFHCHTLIKAIVISGSTENASIESPYFYHCFPIARYQCRRQSHHDVQTEVQSGGCLQ